MIVQDTTPPTLSLTASADCIVPQAGKMVLVRLGPGQDIESAVVDVCDAHPRVAFTGVTVNQGSDVTLDTVPDETTVCLSAEPNQSSLMDRIYTIEVTASDASNNGSQSFVSISVPAAGRSCESSESFSPQHYVEADDPRCNQ